jgi:hypothetical protein
MRKLFLAKSENTSLQKSLMFEQYVGAALREYIRDLENRAFLPKNDSFTIADEIVALKAILRKRQPPRDSA